jgi:periplasmic copper chaperone A
MFRTILVAAMLAAGFAFGAAAQQSPSTIAVTNVWARATPPGAKTGAVYVTVKNSGKAADKLVSISTPVAGEAQLHTTTTEKGVMKMRPLTAIDVKPGASVTLKPGGMHVMLMDLKQPLKEGTSFPVVLDFEKAGRVETMAKVQKVGASAMETDNKPGMNMK